MPTYTVTADTDLTALGKPKSLRAWSFESTVAAGDIKLRNGSVTGDIYVTIRVAVGDSKAQEYSHPGIIFPLGCFVDVVAGTIVGSVTLE